MYFISNVLALCISAFCVKHVKPKWMFLLLTVFYIFCSFPSLGWSRLTDLLRQCRWEGRYYKCEDMFKPINTSYGLCFVFNGPQTRPEDRLHASGTMSSLRVLAYTQNNESYFSRLIHAGVKVSFNWHSFFKYYVQQHNAE